MKKIDANVGVEVVFKPIDVITGKPGRSIYTAIVNDGYINSDGEFKVNLAGIPESVTLDQIEKRWK